MDDPALQVMTMADSGLVDEVTLLLHRVKAVRGVSGLSEGRLRALHGASSGQGTQFLAVAARDPSDGQLVAYAQVDDEGDRSYSNVELVTASTDASAERLADVLLDSVVAEFGAAGGGPLRLWVAQPQTRDDRRASSLGFTIERDLLQLRCTLPLAAVSSARMAGPEATIRPFRVGEDEQAWLIANNRAFAEHPEQGHWDITTIEAREREPWFDADGFRVLELDGKLAGSCWTKIHANSDPPMGEIYAISVDPDHHGQGWGRVLTRSGLDWLAEQGLRTGMLYVDGANTAAMSLYRSMGFSTDHVDRSYVIDVPDARQA